MKTTRRPGVVDAKAAPTQRLNVRITPDAYERLLLHAIKARRNPGDLVTDLIETHLRTYRVQVNPAAQAKIADRHGDSPCVTESGISPALSDAA